jgi:hypothetical protein
LTDERLGGGFITNIHSEININRRGALATESTVYQFGSASEIEAPWLLAQLAKLLEESLDIIM